MSKLTVLNAGNLLRKNNFRSIFKNIQSMKIKLDIDFTEKNIFNQHVIHISVYNPNSNHHFTNGMDFNRSYNFYKRLFIYTSLTEYFFELGTNFIWRIGITAELFV